jgi:uncharacterized coiled-coil protein SlyX
MTKRKLRKNADISPPQSPHDGIHTCSRGCKNPGCTRTLRETIEEQDQQIEALKQDVLEKTAELRKSEEHNAALCERMQDLNSELFAASNINGKLHMNRVHDLNQMGGQCEEIARLKAEVERLTKAHSKALSDFWYIHEGYFRLEAELARLRASSFVTAVPSHQYERIVKAGDAMACHLVCSDLPNDVCGDLMKNWNAAKNGWNAAKEGKPGA